MKIVYDPHAEQRMRERGISKVEVAEVLRNPHTHYSNAATQSDIYLGSVGDRELKVYTDPAQLPVFYVKTVAERKR